MRAGKAYISSLGTTGLLIASSLLLLMVVGAFVAFDSWPGQAAADPEVVSIAAEPPNRDGAAILPDRATLAAARAVATRGVPRASAVASAAGSLRPAATRAGAVQVVSDSDSLELVAPAPVVSELPAPEAAPAPGTRTAPAPPVTAPPADTRPAPHLPVPVPVLELAPGDPAPEYDGRLPDVTAPLGGAVEGTGGRAYERVASVTR